MIAETNSLPASPLDMRDSVETPNYYFDYWRQYLIDHPEQPEALRLRETVQRGAAVFRNRKACRPGVLIPEWDRSLGPFNHLYGATGDLLLGAARALAANQQDSITISPADNGPSTEDIADSFLDMTDQLGDFEQQIPSSLLLTGAQLIHKAALTFEDEDRQTDFLSIAERLYGRVYDGDGRWAETQLRAGLYRHDIRFRAVSTKIRDALREGQVIRDLQNEARRLLRDQIEDFIYIPYVAEFQGCGEGYQNMIGKAFEAFTSILVRREVLLDPSIDPGFPEIRTAFDSEDMPKEPKNRQVNSKFDRVLSRYSADGHIAAAEMWQLKLGEIKNTLPYHPAIQVIRASGIDMDDLLESAYGIQDSLSRHATPATVRPLAKLHQLLEPYLAAKVG